MMTQTEKLLSSTTLATSDLVVECHLPTDHPFQCIGSISAPDVVVAFDFSSSFERRKPVG